MEQYINKTVRLFIDINKKKLSFEAFVLNVDSSHIHFRDKYGDDYSFNKKYVEEVKPL